VHAPWRLHADDVRHSLEGGYFQGWDLHPGQLATRYAAVYAFFLAGLASGLRAPRQLRRQGRPGHPRRRRVRRRRDRPGPLNFFLRGINCGALREEEALRAGVTLDELRGRSFVKILKNRRGLA
jgi:hypothetical protein